MAGEEPVERRGTGQRRHPGRHRRVASSTSSTRPRARSAPGASASSARPASTPRWPRPCTTPSACACASCRSCPGRCSRAERLPSVGGCRSAGAGVAAGTAWRSLRGATARAGAPKLRRAGARPGVAGLRCTRAVRGDGHRNAAPRRDTSSIHSPPSSARGLVVRSGRVPEGCAPAAAGPSIASATRPSCERPRPAFPVGVNARCARSAPDGAGRETPGREDRSERLPR